VAIRPRKPDRPMLSPVCHIRIVAGFGREGKSDDARKSRIFNNLEYANVPSGDCF
jgi:hypothetical protein